MEKGIAVPQERRAAVQVTVGPALYWDKAGWGTFSLDASHVFAGLQRRSRAAGVAAGPF